MSQPLPTSHWKHDENGAVVIESDAVDGND